MTQPEFSIEALRVGDQEAMAHVFKCHFQRLVREARHHLATVPRRTFDDEDIAIAALTTIVMRIANGSMPAVATHADLYRVLSKTVRTKATDEIRKMLAQKRGGGNVRGESVFLPQGRIDKSCAESETDARMQSIFSHLAEVLDSEELLEVAMLRLEGFTTKEISHHLGCSRRTVQRRLKLIETVLQSNDDFRSLIAPLNA